MPIHHEYTTPISGAVAKYHVIKHMTFDFASSRTQVQVDSYVDEEIYKKGMAPVYVQYVWVDGIPAPGLDPRTVIQQQLIKEYEVVDNVLHSNGGPVVDHNRDAFVGGVHVDDPEPHLVI